MNAAELKYIELGQQLINKLPPGRYFISEIYGDDWEYAPGGNRFGTPFKAAVLSGRLEGIFHVERKTDNNNLYEIFK